MSSLKSSTPIGIGFISVMAYTPALVFFKYTISERKKQLQDLFFSLCASVVIRILLYRLNLTHAVVKERLFHIKFTTKRVQLFPD